MSLQFCMSCWPILLLSFIWMYYDWNAPRQGGYDTLFLRKWGLNKYFANYFPVKFHKTATLPPGQVFLVFSPNLLTNMWSLQFADHITFGEAEAHGSLFFLIF